MKDVASPDSTQVESQKKRKAAAPSVRGWLPSVAQTLELYLRIKAAPPISAVDPDPQPASRRICWTKEGAAFTHDLERTVQSIFDQHPDERHEFVRAYKNLLIDADRLGERFKEGRSQEYLAEWMQSLRITDHEARLIVILGRLIKDRGLHPRSYFKPNRYIHREPRRPRAVTAGAAA